MSGCKDMAKINSAHGPFLLLKHLYGRFLTYSSLLLLTLIPQQPLYISPSCCKIAMDSQPDVHKRKGANYNTTEDITAIQVLLGESLNSDADYRCGIPSIEEN